MNESLKCFCGSEYWQLNKNFISCRRCKFVLARTMFFKSAEDLNKEIKDIGERIMWAKYRELKQDVEDRK